MATYSNNNLKIRFDYPSDWSILQETDKSVTIGSPRSFDRDPYRESIRVYPFTNNRSVDDEVQHVVDHLEKREGYTFGGITRDVLGNPQKSARKFECTYQDDKVGTLRMTFFIAKEGVQGIEILYKAQQNYHATFLPVLTSVKDSFAFL